MTNRVANKDARRYVQNLEEFQGSNTYAEWRNMPDGSQRYIVCSYGPHWPLFIYDNERWYENADKVSVSTSKHHGKLHPMRETEKHSADDMQEIARYGITGWVARTLGKAV